jgi:hypothetical protein
MSQKTQKQIIKILPDCQIKSELLQIIGGTACDIIIDEAGFVPRATKDI